MHTVEYQHGIVFNFDGDMEGELYVKGPDAAVYDSLDVPDLQLEEDWRQLPQDRQPKRVEVTATFEQLRELALHPGEGELVIEGPDREYYSRFDDEAQRWLKGEKGGVRTAKVRVSMAAVRGLVIVSYEKHIEEALADAYCDLDSPEAILMLDQILALSNRLKDLPPQME